MINLRRAVRLGMVLVGQFLTARHGSSVDSLSGREVLILSLPRPNKMQQSGHPVPLVRMITNEPIFSENGIRSYLTEDITILENGQAMYFMDSVQMSSEYGGTDHDIGVALADSRSPLFLVNGQNELIISNKRSWITPIAMLQVIEDARSFRVFPFGGAYGSVEDSNFALNRAQELLDSIRDIEPSHAYGKAM